MSDSEEIPTVPIRIYLNKDFNATKDFEKSNDVWVDVRLERDCDSNMYELQDLITDVKSKFKSHKQLKTTDIKNRLRDKAYNIIFLGYELNNHIEDDDELTQDIEDIFPSSDSDSDHSDNNRNSYRNNNNNKLVKLRIIFKELGQPQPNPPKLYQKRIGRYFDTNIKQMAYYNLFEWNKPNLNNDEKTDIIWVYDIKEINTNRNDLNITIEQQLSYVIKPLNSNTKYIFQIKVYSKMDNNICSIWSEPKILYTPNMIEQNNNLLPKPKYLYVTSLLCNSLCIKFDPGFVNQKNEQIRYWYKEKNIYKAVPFGVAQHSYPFGGFHKSYQINPNTQYKIVIYTENRTTHQESLESDALLVKTPMKNWKINYKPQPPNNIYGMVDNEYKYDESNHDHKMDIIIFWTLPPNTYGNEIKYQIKIDQNEPEMIEGISTKIMSSYIYCLSESI